MTNKITAFALGFALCIFLLPARIRAQETPFNPVSYRIFTPFLFNPAITGSKDFSSVDYGISNYMKRNSHLLSGNFRVPRSAWKYYSSLSNTQYSGIGLGGYAFSDNNATWKNSGAGVAVSYHIQLDREAVSFLSFGLGGKAIVSRPSPLTEAASDVSTVQPDADAGVYYYNPVFYAGISVMNILNNYPAFDTLRHSAPYTREFFLNTGFKIIVSKSADIVIEPSLIINTDVTFSGSLWEIVRPALRVYAGNFCLGSYLNEPGKIPFFIQYKYSKVYIAAYFELPGEPPFYKQPVRTEFALGVNLSAFKKGYNFKNNHW